MPSLNTKLASAPNTTSNYVLKATSSTTIGNSLIYDNGTNGIGFGTASPISTTGYMFTTIDGVSGSGYITRVNGTTALYSYSNATESRLAEQRALPLIFETNGSERLRITSDGKLKLTSTSGGGTNLDMYLTENDGLYINSNEGATGRAIYFQTGGTTRATITSAGVLAIGSTGNSWGSGYKAINLGAGWGMMASGTNEDGYICSNTYYNGSNWVASNSASLKPSVLRIYDGYVFQVGTTAAVGATTTLTDVMNISSSGNVSINQSPTPTNVKFKIRTNDQSTSNYSFLIDNAIYDTFWVRNDGLVNITARKLAEVVTITNGRNASGDYALVTAMGANTNNTGSYHIICSTGGADKFYVYGNGNVVNANNSYGPLSDIKLKENITDATPKLDKLMQVRIVNYNLINNPELKQIGVIAQELENVFPALVDEQIDRDREGNDLGTTTKSVKMSVFVPMLIKAIQEQQSIITELTDKVNRLYTNHYGE